MELDRDSDSESRTMLTPLSHGACDRAGGYARPAAQIQAHIRISMKLCAK